MNVFELFEAKKKSLKNPADNPCWTDYHPVGTKQKAGRTVPKCVPNEGVEEAANAAQQAAIAIAKKKKSGVAEGADKNLYNTIDNLLVGYTRTLSTDSNMGGYTWNNGKQVINVEVDPKQPNLAYFALGTLRKNGKVNWVESGDDGSREVLGIVKTFSKGTLREDVAEGKWNYPPEYTKKANADDEDELKVSLINKDARKAWRKKQKAKAHKDLMTGKKKEPGVSGEFKGELDSKDRFTKDTVQKMFGKLSPDAKGVAEAGHAGADDTDTVGFYLDTERAYQAVMGRYGDMIDHDETSGIMYVPARLWPKIEMIAFDADGIGALRDDDLENPEHYGIAEAAVMESRLQEMRAAGYDIL